MQLRVVAKKSTHELPERISTEPNHKLQRVPITEFYIAYCRAFSTLHRSYCLFYTAPEPCSERHMNEAI